MNLSDGLLKRVPGKTWMAATSAAMTKEWLGGNSRLLRGAYAPPLDISEQA